MNNSWRLYFLNVGDGDCIYLENDSQSFNILIDGGRTGVELIFSYPVIVTRTMPAVLWQY